MGSDSADVLAEILRTTLHLVEQRRDLDQSAPSVSKLKESMRRTIAEVEQNKKPRKADLSENEERLGPMFYERRAVLNGSFFRRGAVWGRKSPWRNRARFTKVPTFLVQLWIDGGSWGS